MTDKSHTAAGVLSETEAPWYRGDGGGGDAAVIVVVPR